MQRRDEITLDVRCAIVVRELISVRHGSIYNLCQSHKSWSLPAGVVGNSRTRHALHGCIGKRCATPLRLVREQNNRGWPHDFGDCSATSVKAIRRVHDGSTNEQSQSGRRKKLNMFNLSVKRRSRLCEWESYGTVVVRRLYDGYNTDP